MLSFDRYSRWLWVVALVSVLGIGTAIRLIEVTYDRYDFDEYHLRLDVDQNLLEYYRHLEGTDAIQFAVHYWLTHRLLGGSLIAYRAASLAAGLAVLVLVPLGLRRAWPAHQSLMITVPLLMILNADALYLTRYAMFPYGNTYLLSAGLFFLFLRLARGPLPRRQWLLITVALPVVAFFANDFLIVALAVGACAVMLFRAAPSGRSERLRALATAAWEMKPLLILPAVFALRQVAFPYTNWGAAVRSDQVDLYFPTSGYPATVEGLAGFLVSNTRSLFWSVLAPAGVQNQPYVRIAWLGICACLVALSCLHVLRRRADRATTFTFTFLLLCVTALAVGGLTGLYPYGSARYTPFLFLPTAIMIGMGTWLAYGWVAARVDTPRLWVALFTGLVGIIVVSGVVVCVARWAKITAIHQDDEHGIAWLTQQDPDLVLSDYYLFHTLADKLPTLRDRLRTMGRGTYLDRGQDVVPDEIAEIIADPLNRSRTDTILVVLYPHGYGRTDQYRGFAHRHPRWESAITSYFALTSTHRSFHMDALLYRRIEPVAHWRADPVGTLAQGAGWDAAHLLHETINIWRPPPDCRPAMLRTSPQSCPLER